MIGKYCEEKYNIATGSNSIQLGTAEYYRKQNINSGIFDDEEGIIYYKINDAIELTKEVSENYFDSVIQSDGNNGLIYNGGFDIEIPNNISDGLDGQLKINGDSDKLLKMDLTSFYIFSTTVLNSPPTLNNGKNIDKSYDSFYEIIEPEIFCKTIAQKLLVDTNNGKLILGSKNKIGAEKINVHCQVGMVTYDISKTEEMLQKNDSKLTFNERQIKAIFNKNTRHNHDYQNEFRFVFWFTDSEGELLKLPNDHHILFLDNLKSFSKLVNLI